jgi:hypothetical protein
MFPALPNDDSYLDGDAKDEREEGAVCCDIASSTLSDVISALAKTGECNECDYERCCRVRFEVALRPVETRFDSVLGVD